MKYIDEYRDARLAKELLDQIRRTVTRRWHIMEICGGQTHSLVKNGILELLPPEVVMIHGPGCPVCVTPRHLIDKAVYLAEEEGVILCSFGDMVRVPGSRKSLSQAKAGGADVRIMYSPLEAVKLARRRPDREVVFFAVGFETTAPANALAVLTARKLGLKNFSLLVSHVLVPPAIRTLMDDPRTHIDGFLAAGHVCAITGYREYRPLARQYRIPITVTGFEPVDLLRGLLATVRQLEGGTHRVENAYSRVVREEGNLKALEIIRRVFRTGDRHWRGIGLIPDSGWHLRNEFADMDAEKKFRFPFADAGEDTACIAGEIMKGIKKPFDCPHFGSACTPRRPLGAPMVSSEGACAAYYRFRSLIKGLN
ncbi:MAG: hydrogenase formation protein HypD [Chlorobi bacterium]|nr:hydrogenase formation protein HypD [Chlorobiota bacterium]